MKKISLSFILLSLLLSAGFILPIGIDAAIVVSPTQCTLVENLTDIDGACTDGATVSITDYGVCCAVNSIYKVVNVAFMFLAGIAVLLFLIGAFTLMTAAGSPEKVTSGRNYILYAIVGLALAMLAKSVPMVAKLMIGGV